MTAKGKVTPALPVTPTKRKSPTKAAMKPGKGKGRDKAEEGDVVAISDNRLSVSEQAFLVPPDPDVIDSESDPSEHKSKKHHRHRRSSKESKGRSSKDSSKGKDAKKEKNIMRITVKSVSILCLLASVCLLLRLILFQQVQSQCSSN